jgi:RHS repeat-associated protein
LQRATVTASGSTSATDTIYFDGYTETAINGINTSTIKYYSANGQRIAMNQQGTLTYLVSDLLGNSTLTLKSDGTLYSAQLFNPFGSVRYSDSTMPNSFSFTGQRLDNQTGLLYYNFRYYDPVSGRFTRTDTKETNAAGMDTYGYVHGNPETMCDPTGHWGWDTVLAGVCGVVIGAALITAVAVAVVILSPAIVATAAVIAATAATIFTVGLITGTAAEITAADMAQQNGTEVNNKDAFLVGAGGAFVGGAGAVPGVPPLISTALTAYGSTLIAHDITAFDVSHQPKSSKSNPVIQGQGDPTKAVTAKGHSLLSYQNPRYQAYHQKETSYRGLSNSYSYVYSDEWKTSTFNTWTDNGFMNAGVSWQSYQSQVNYEYVKLRQLWAS